MQKGEMLENIKKYIDIASRYVDADKGILEILNYCKRELIVHFPVRMDDGELRVFTGYRVIHSPTLGPGKGGIRYSPDLDLEETRALAILMSWKAALLNIPFGGAKGGVRCNTKELSEKELENLTRRFTWEIAPYIGRDSDILAPDMYTNPRIMAWIMDTYSILKGYSVPEVVTGKPLELGGSLGRFGATGRSVFLCAVEAVKYLGIAKSVKGMTVAIQGAGNVGGTAAQLFHEAGARVVAVSNSRTGFYNSDGLDISRIFSFENKYKFTLANINNLENISNEELLELDCDILIPAATAGQIIKENAPKLRCRILVEGANNPTTPEADAILHERKIFTVPDILANSGGLIVSYFEWVQNLQEILWTDSEVHEHLKEKIEKAFAEVIDFMKTRNVNTRTAAYALGIERVARAMELRGIYP